MREPNYERDGWCLDDGEAIHREAPATFLIQNLETRRSLQVGDLAKLIFRIAVRGDEFGSVERMWVIVRERTSIGYVGTLDNKPDAIEPNDEFWLGTELPFEYRHIIDVCRASAESLALAKAPAPLAWKP